MSAFIASSKLNGWNETRGVISPGLFRSATPGAPACHPAALAADAVDLRVQVHAPASTRQMRTRRPCGRRRDGFPVRTRRRRFFPRRAGRAPARTGPRRYRIRPCRLWSPGRGRRPRVVDVFTSGTHVTILRPLQNKQPLSRKREAEIPPLISIHSIGRRPKRETVG